MQMDEGSGLWVPGEIFGAGEPGVAYDMTDKDLLYQDSARTTLVSANGDPIGSVTDLSGNGKHASQATTASKPLFQGYADFDGVDDSWATAAIDFTGTDAVTVVVGIRMLSNATVGLVAALGNYNSDLGTFGLRAPRTTDSRLAWYSRGTLSAGEVATPSVYTAPVSLVATGTADISGDSSAIRVNGVQINASASDQGTGNYSNAALSIGGDASHKFNGRIYRMIVIGRTLTADELAQAEAWCAEPAGVVLA